MPGSLKETYVGPGARWAMLLVDYPEAAHKESLVPVDECDTPVQFRKKQKVSGGDLRDVTHVAKCVIDFGTNSGREPVVAYRFPDDWEKARNGNSWYCPTDETPTGWETWSSKTLHRALKEAGYPADTKEIQLWLLYRRRVAENEAIRRGVLPAPLASLPAEEERRVIESAGSSDEGMDAEHTDTPAAAAPAPAALGSVSDETMARIRALPDQLRERLEGWIGERDLNLAAFDSNRTAQAYLASLEQQARKQAEAAAADDAGRPFTDEPAAAVA